MNLQEVPHSGSDSFQMTEAFTDKTKNVSNVIHYRSFGVSEFFHAVLMTVPYVLAHLREKCIYKTLESNKTEIVQC